MDYSCPGKNTTRKNEDHAGLGIRLIDKYIRPSAGVELTEHDAAADKNFPLDDTKLAIPSMKFIPY